MSDHVGFNWTRDHRQALFVIVRLARTHLTQTCRYKRIQIRELPVIGDDTVVPASVIRCDNIQVQRAPIWISRIERQYFVR